MKAVGPLQTINMHRMVLKKRESDGDHEQNDGARLRGGGSPSRKHVSQRRQFHEKRFDKLGEEQVQERGLMAPWAKKRNQGRSKTCKAEGAVQEVAGPLSQGQCKTTSQEQNHCLQCFKTHNWIHPEVI